MMTECEQKDNNRIIVAEKECTHFPKSYPLLPEVLLSKTTNQATSLPASVLERLNYLWNTANEILTQNEDELLISHRLSL